MLLLLRWVAEHISPGFGTVTAATIGLGTLLLPFGTMFFVHVLSAAVAFLAFVVLWYERRQRPNLGRSSHSAGLLAGFSITAEYPAGVVAVALAAYAASRRPFLARGASYAAGLLVGLLPLFAFNRWAFGSAFHLSYVGTVQSPGASGHDVLFEYEGLFGVSVPRLEAERSSSSSRTGVSSRPPPSSSRRSQASPLLFRRGLRAEALLVSFLCVAYVAYVSAFLRPWGDVAPGPRYLILLVLFLGIPLACAYRRFPWATPAPGCRLGRDHGGRH